MQSLLELCCSTALNEDPKMEEKITEQAAVTPVAPPESRWGVKLFIATLVGLLLFFWWLLIYSGGVELHH